MRDPFEFDDYFVQDYIGTIQRIVFAENDYGTLQATVTNRFDEPVIGDDGEVRTDRMEYYNVGQSKDWRTVEGGSGFCHVSEPDRRIRSNSAYGALIIRIVDLVGKDEILARATAEPPLNPLYVSSTYEGLRFHWVTEGAGQPYTLKDRQTGEVRTGTTRGRQMPVEYLPEGAVLVTASDYDIASLGLDGEMLADLTTLAKGSTYSEFQRDGISFLQDLQGDNRRAKLVSALSEQRFYEALRAS